MQNNQMTSYKIEKPEKGAGALEYFLKYITIFIVVGFIIWGILIFSITNGTISEIIYWMTMFFSFGLSAMLVSYLLTLEINKNKQGTIYQIDFDDAKQIVALHLFNEFTGDSFIKEIPFSNLNIVDKKQKIDIKAEQRLKIYNNSILVNNFNIPKTAWTVHSRVVRVVDKFREIANNLK